MAKIFGYSRVGDNVYYTMNNGIEMAINDNHIFEVNEKITLK